MSRGQGVFTAHSIFTDSLPKLCSRGNCTKDRVPSTQFCQEHQKKLRTRPKRYKGKSIDLDGVMMGRTTLYFISCDDAKAVKIGITDNFKLRFLNLQGSNPLKIELITKFNCLKHYEEKVHELLSNYRIRGEWFRMEGYVLELIRELGDYNQERTLKRILYERDI